MLLQLDSIVLEAPHKGNHFRPTIDALFLSAANIFGLRVIGIILSGLLNDGAQGLSTIRGAGGISIVQEPGDARFKDMPKNALRFGPADFVVPAGDMCALLDMLV